MQKFKEDNSVYDLGEVLISTRPANIKGWGGIIDCPIVSYYDEGELVDLSTAGQRLIETIADISEDCRAGYADEETGQVPIRFGKWNALWENSNINVIMSYIHLAKMNLFDRARSMYVFIENGCVLMEYFINVDGCISRISIPFYRIEDMEVCEVGSLMTFFEYVNLHSECGVA